jgi:hypothetical protein
VEWFAIRLKPSANVFNEWNNGIKWISLQREMVLQRTNTIDEEIKEPNNLFDFFVKEDLSYSHEENNLIEVFGGLLIQMKKQKL